LPVGEFQEQFSLMAQRTLDAVHHYLYEPIEFSIELPNVILGRDPHARIFPWIVHLGFWPFPFGNEVKPLVYWLGALLPIEAKEPEFFSRGRTPDGSLGTSTIYLPARSAGTTDSLPVVIPTTEEGKLAGIALVRTAHKKKKPLLHLRAKQRPS
jgi:hypothetical protein